MKQLSKRALQFIEKSGRNKEYDIDSKIIEEHLKLYSLQDSSKIIKFHEMFSGFNFQDIIIHIFTPKQINENKKVNTYEWKNQTLLSINNSFYIAENGEIALKDFPSSPYDIIFYFESFATFIEQQAFFEKNRYYKKLPSVFYEIPNIKEFSKAMSDYDFLEECSDKYNLIWRNEVNLVHATNSSDIWSVGFDSISEQNRYFLIDKLKEKHLIT